MSCVDVGILFFYSSGRNEEEEKKIKKWKENVKERERETEDVVV